jgi:CRISPR-associated protein Cmx8
MSPAGSPRRRGAGKAGDQVPDVLQLDYSLAELPSAQHRAGLAGLVLMVRWLSRQADATGICTVTHVDDARASLTIDRAGMCRLFDELYAATNEEVRTSQPRKDKNSKQIIPPLREEEEQQTDARGKLTRRKVYVYPQVVPHARMLLEADPTAQGNQGLWIKLWRDLVWNILRGVPAQRKPFQARAHGETTSDGESMFAELARAADASVELPSTYYLGAQASTADNVPFRDRARFRFLLHFWPYVAQIYVPMVLSAIGERPNLGTYALAIPDVARLATFCDVLPRLLRERESAAFGKFRPRGAIVDLAIETALDLGQLLRERLIYMEGRREAQELVLGFDVLHVAKEGDNVRLLFAGHFVPEPRMYDAYARLKEHGRYTLWDPLFRRTRLINLVERRPWYSSFDKLFHTLPYDMKTLGSRDFCHDARWSFDPRNRFEDNMSQPSPRPARSLEEVIYQLVRSYVAGRIKDKTGLEWKAIKDQPQQHKRYNEACESIVTRTFLDIRSRRNDEDFIEYFAGTLCKVPHYLPEDDFISLSRTLRSDAGTVRTLTLLALSAVPRFSTKDPQEETPHA